MVLRLNVYSFYTQPFVSIHLIYSMNRNVLFPVRTTREVISKDMDIKEWVAGHNEEALMADGFDEAIIGMCERFGNPVVAYDRARCIEILAQKFDQEEDPDVDVYEEAEDYFSYNVSGSYVGENTPVFITLWTGERGDRLLINWLPYDEVFK